MLNGIAMLAISYCISAGRADLDRRSCIVCNELQPPFTKDVAELMVFLICLFGSRGFVS